MTGTERKRHMEKGSGPRLLSIAVCLTIFCLMATNSANSQVPLNVLSEQARSGMLKRTPVPRVSPQRALERAAEVGAERALTRAPVRERVIEQPVVVRTGRADKKTAELAAKKAAEEVLRKTKSSQAEVEKALEKAAERGAEKVAGKVAEKVANKLAEQAAKKPLPDFRNGLEGFQYAVENATQVGVEKAFSKTGIKKPYFQNVLETAAELGAKKVLYQAPATWMPLIDKYVSEALSVGRSPELQVEVLQTRAEALKINIQQLTREAQALERAIMETPALRERLAKPSRHLRDYIGRLGTAGMKRLSDSIRNKDERGRAPSEIALIKAKIELAKARIDLLRTEIRTR